MEAGAPLPAIKRIASDLLVSYICCNPKFPGWDSGAEPNHPGFDEYCAVLKFHDVSWSHFGAPSDERLHEHPLYKQGLTFYAFHEVENSQKVKDNNLRHWIITFHDETLEVIGRDIELLSARIDSGDPSKTLETFSEQVASDNADKPRV